ncbi:uncharacterized protein LOC8059905 [Sorghum bicolor]|nr:uncharacterized protein LOC8059905 [Sorghum bicolor]|eukprot:XP_002461400.2 uncharacterized protein LOC8059905 [Sorghum bicolor]
MIGSSSRAPPLARNQLSPKSANPHSPPKPSGCSMAPPPPELNPDAVSEILLRLPPEDPASLVRASAVCKPWLRTLTDPAFLRRYRAFHGTPRVLGFLHSRSIERFVPTTGFRPHAAAAAILRTCDAVFDCRHGRALLYDCGSMEFVVCDPVTGRERRMFDAVPDRYNYAVLCAAGAGCDHCNCRGPFLLACAGVHFSHCDVFFARFYSSDTGTWSLETKLYMEDSQYQYYGYRLKNQPAVLVGGALYYVCNFSILLRYDILGGQDLSVIKLPKANHFESVIVIPAEDSELGLASLYRNRNSLCLWSRETEVGRDASWVQQRVIDLNKLLPATNLKRPACFSGFAEGANVIFVSTYHGDVFCIDLNSMGVRKVCEMGYGYRIFPYVCFYTPAACARGALPSHVETQ